MSEGYPTAAQREALRLICDHQPLRTEQLGELLITARPSSGNPGYARAIGRMAGMLIWRLSEQGFAVDSPGGWRVTGRGRELIRCST